MRRILIAIVPCLLLGCAANNSSRTAGYNGSWDGEVRVYGSLRAIFHSAQTGAAVTLDGLLPNRDLYALGALAELRGEITIVGGTAYLTLPEGGETTRTVTASRTNAAAALLVVSEVPDWRAVTVRNPIRFDEVDEGIERLAAAAGLSLDDRFPFLVEGEVENLQWHVVDGSRLVAGATSHQDHRAASTRGELDRAPATLVGFFSAEDQGVFTHMGSKTHIHCVLDNPPFTGHVDHVIIPEGAIIKFPADGCERIRQSSRWSPSRTASVPVRRS